MPHSQAAHSSRRSQQRLQVVAADPRVETALHWAAHRLDHAEAVFDAFGLLALGDLVAARSVIVSLDRTHAADGDAALLWLWLMARYHAASGDLAFLRAQWQWVHAVLAVRRPDDSDDVNAVAWAAVLRELGLTAESIGERDDAHRLRAEASRVYPSPNDHAAALLELLARRHSSLTGWAHYTAGNSEAGFRHWWPGVLSCCGGADDLSDQTPAAGAMVATLVYGLLGFEPDAAKHRVRLRPAVPPEWNAVDVNNLRISDSTLALSYARTDTVHSFRVSPTSGAVPLRLIFEPAVFANQIDSISVDGVAASLDVHAWGDRRLCPVQVVLDQEREVVIRTGLQ